MCVGVGVFLGSLGSACACLSSNRHRSAGHNRMYMGVCMCTGAVNRAVTHASILEALVHTNRRAVMMSVHVLASKTVIGRRREGTSNAASSGRLEPPTISLLLVHDPGGPAWIRQASPDIRDNVTE